MTERVVFLPAEERAWGLECLAAGDTLEDIAEMSGRPIAHWQHQLGSAVLMTPRQRQILRHIDAGLTIRRVAADVGAHPNMVWIEIQRLRRLGLPVRTRPRGRVAADA